MPMGSHSVTCHPAEVTFPRRGVPGTEKSQSQIHVGKQRRERPARLQRVLRSFLHTNQTRMPVVATPSDLVPKD